MSFIITQPSCSLGSGFYLCIHYIIINKWRLFNNAHLNIASIQCASRIGHVMQKRVSIPGEQIEHLSGYVVSAACLAAASVEAFIYLCSILPSQEGENNQYL